MMNLPYIIQVQICIALFWVVYRLFMRNSGAFIHNRVYLLGSIAFSFIIPALSIPVWPAPEAQGNITIGNLEAWMFLVEDAEAGIAVNWTHIALWISGIGILAMTVGVSRHIIRMTRSIRCSKVLDIEHAKIVCDDKIHSPYSFFRYIFVNDSEEKKNELPQIVAHEMAHIRLGHSYDAVFIQLMLIIFWWNPFVWLWSRSLKEVHEFQADEAVLQQGFDSKQYITLLIGTLADIHPEFVSGFSYSLIKKRLLMMTKQTSRFSKFRILTAIPVLAGTLLLFSFTEKPAVEAEVKNTISPEVSAEIAPPPVQDQDQDVPFVSAEEMPKFQGGDLTTFRNWVMRQVIYPAEAANKNIQGRVIARFIIEKDGSISNIEIINSPDKLLSDEVVRILSSSPKWTPGKQRGESIRVSFNLPVQFSLQSKDGEKKEKDITSHQTSSSTSVSVNNGVVTTTTTTVSSGEGTESTTVLKYNELAEGQNPPTIFVNGKAFNGSLKNLPETDIASISVTQGESAHPNGLIYITLKDGANVSSDSQNKRTGSLIFQSTTPEAAQKFTTDIQNSDSDKPLIFIDGKEVTYPEFTNFPVEKVESITVMKDNEATKQYGEAAKAGVILIKTKNI